MIKIFSSITAVLIMFASLAFAFDDKITHPLLTQEAVKHAATFQDVINDQLGIDQGIDAEFAIDKHNFSIKDWLKRGSEKEDSPICRAANHFHNPTKPWSEAMLTDSTFFVEFKCGDAKYSNLVWATGFTDKDQTPLDPPVNNDLNVDNGRNWSVARGLFYMALIEPDPDLRDRYLAETFLTLGHVVHLLQDTAVPAHTRNDFSQGHLRIIGLPGQGYSWKDKLKGWVGNPFEGYVRNNWDIIDAQISEISQPYTGEKNLTNFWDTDTAVTPQTGFDIGLAEYSNMNFVSYNTVFKKESDPNHYFQYPGRDSVSDPVYPERADYWLYQVWARDEILDKVVYVKKNGPREEIDKFLKPRYIPYYLGEAFGEGVERWDLELTLDDNCYLEYAKRLIPRAIGYSASLLDYFFRGRLEISHPDQFIYSITDGSNLPYYYVNEFGRENHQQQFSFIRAKIRNITPESTDEEGNTLSYEEMGPGKIMAVARYKVVKNYLPDLSNYPPTIFDVWEHYTYSISKPVSVDGISHDQDQELLFDFDEDPIPVGISDLTLQIVFIGTLGSEKNMAVAVGLRDLSEPDHHVFWNSTDQVVIDKNLYTGDQIRNDPYLFNYVDRNNNGILNETGEPYIDPFPVSYELSFSEEDPQNSSVETFSAAKIYNLPPKRHSRLIILTDQPAPASSWITAVTYNDPWDYNAVYNYYYSFESARVRLTPEELITSLIPADYVYRGVLQHHFLANYYCTVIDPRLLYDPDKCPDFGPEWPIPDNLEPFPVQLHFP